MNAQFLLWGLLLFFLGCNSQKVSQPSVHELSGQVFGSTYSIKYVGDLNPDNWKAELEVFFKEFNQEFSTYQTDSVISLFNQAPAGKKITVSIRFIQMLKLAQSLHQQTQGAFDPTLGPVIKAWGFSRNGTPRTPSEKEIREAKSKMGLSQVRWDETTLTIWKTRDGLTLNLNAFAPGWTADLLSEVLQEKGIQNYMIDIGGEILVKGKKADNSEWIIGIEEPSDKPGHQIRTAVKLLNGSIATSGDYRQFFNDQGIRKSHIIDPRSGRPVAHQISSATVLASSAALADAWGTAMMVLGEEGLELAEKQGISVMLLKADKPGSYSSIVSQE